MAAKATFRTLLIAATSAFALAACSNERVEYDSAASPPPMAVAESANLKRAYAQGADEGAAGGGEPVTGDRLLAYSYSMAVEAPRSQVGGLLSAHQAACQDAGPRVCQVIRASTNQWGEDQINGELYLRAKPDWLETFRGMIASDAEKSGGRLTSNTVNAEDLTAYIVDVEARLEAKKTLRDRIRNLLETNEGSLSDILQAERALADVQGEIDSMTAQLSAARARVDMSSLSISYRTDPETQGGVLRPLSDAFRDFGRNSVRSLAEAVNFIAGAWPFIIIGVIALFLLRAWLRGFRRRQA